MSLDFDYRAVERRFAVMKAPTDRPGDYKKGDAIHHPVMSTAIWRLMAIGMTEVTEKNYETCYQRSLFYETLYPEVKINVPKPLPFEGFEARHFTRDDWFHLIGLKTNVSTETDTAWRKRIVAAWFADQTREHNRGNSGETLYKAYFERFPDCLPDPR